VAAVEHLPRGGVSSATATFAPRTARRATAVRLGQLAGGCGLLSLLLWRLYGSPTIGYDTFYALTWGGQLANGDLPQYEVAHGPTPHPLATLVAAVLAPLGTHDAMVAVRVISVVGLAALAVLCFVFGRRLWSLGVGLLFAGLVLTRPVLVGAALNSAIDLPFLCLSLGALLLAVTRPRDRYGVLALLGAAGLLRPEAWLFTAVFIVWRWRASTQRERGLMLGLAALAPALWITSDAIITGRPAYSFSRTRMIAEHTGEQRGGIVQTVAWTARSWKGILHVVPALAALGGLLAGLRYQRSRALPPAVLMGLGSVSFLATGLSGLPLLVRYFLLPGAILCLFAAVGLLGWQELAAGGALRTWWARVAAVGLLALAVSIPWEARSLDRVASRFGVAATAQRDLERLTKTPAMQAALVRCPPLQTRNFRARPELLFLWYERRPQPQVVASRSLVPRDGLLLRYRGELQPTAAPGFTPVVGNATWTLLQRCPARAR
jgi:hypothetical protein